MKGRAFFDRYLQQTNQGGLDQRKEMLHTLTAATDFRVKEDQLADVEEVQLAIKNASDGAPGPDGIRCVCVCVRPSQVMMTIFLHPLSKMQLEL